MEPSFEKPRNDRRHTLFITAISLVIVYILWNVPELEVILYPLRLFVTYVHESGHAIMTIVTGGTITEFVVEAGGGGHIRHLGGAAWLVSPAGYIGAAMFGSTLFFLVNRLPRWANGIAYLLGGGMVAFTLAFVLPTASQPLAVLIGVGFGVLLIIIGSRFSQMITLLILNVLAVVTALNAVFDVFILMRAVNAGVGQNDAANFSRAVTPLIPASFIALTWAGIAILLFAIAFYLGVWKPLHSELNSSYDSLFSR